MATERHEQRLADLLRAARAAPRPRARERALSAMAQAALVARSRRRWSISRRKLVSGAAFAAALVATAVWLTPRQQGAALADVGRAMANVESAHFVGWHLDLATGERRQVEGWVKGATKLRVVTEGATDIADDGQRFVTLQNYNGVPTAWIEPPKRVRGFKGNMPYFTFFMGGEGLTSMLESDGYMVEYITTGSLPHGRAATLIELRHMDGGKAVLTVDAHSNLLIKWETFDSSGTLTSKVDGIQYNVEIPDSIFDITIPEGTPVIDYLTPASPDIIAAQKREAKKLEAAGGEKLSSFGKGMCGTPYHEGLHFLSLDSNGIILLYFRDRNTYHVAGRALAFTLGGAFSQVVEDAEIKAPGKPDLDRRDRITRELPPTWREREAAARELMRAGGALMLNATRGGCSCGTPYHPKLRFQILSADGCWIVYMPDENAYHIFGTARVFGMGLDEVVTNSEIQAPGPAEQPDE